MRDIKTRRISIADLLVLIAFSGVILVASLSLVNVLSNPNKFADSLGPFAGLMGCFCMIGLIGFPIGFTVLGLYLFRRCESPFRILYAAFAFTAAIASIPVAHFIMGACVNSIL